MNVLLHAIRTVDLSIYHFLSGVAGNWILDRLASQEETNNLFKGGIFFAMYWYLWFRIDRDRERSRRAIITIVIGTILAIIVARTIACIAPFRLRPIYDPTLAHPSYSIPLTANFENWSAFPSDTAAYFFALAFGLAYLLAALLSRLCCTRRDGSACLECTWGFTMDPISCRYRDRNHDGVGFAWE